MYISHRQGATAASSILGTSRRYQNTNTASSLPDTQQLAQHHPRCVTRKSRPEWQTWCIDNGGQTCEDRCNLEKRRSRVSKPPPNPSITNQSPQTRQVWLVYSIDECIDGLTNILPATPYPTKKTTTSRTPRNALEASPNQHNSNSPSPKSPPPSSPPAPQTPRPVRPIKPYLRKPPNRHVPPYHLTNRSLRGRLRP